jgi:hypothetical protein
VLSDAQWQKISGLIIGRPDRKGSTGRDNRMFVEGPCGWCGPARHGVTCRKRWRLQPRVPALQPVERKRRVAHSRSRIHRTARQRFMAPAAPSRDGKRSVRPRSLEPAALIQPAATEPHLAPSQGRCGRNPSSNRAPRLPSALRDRCRFPPVLASGAWCIQDISDPAASAPFRLRWRR